MVSMSLSRSEQYMPTNYQSIDKMLRNHNYRGKSVMSESFVIIWNDDDEDNDDTFYSSLITPTDVHLHFGNLRS